MLMTPPPSDEYRALSRQHKIVAGVLIAVCVAAVFAMLILG